MMLVPVTRSPAAMAGVALVPASAIAPEAHAFIVPRVSSRPESPLAFELALPAAVQTLALVGILVPEESLLANAYRTVSLVVIRHLHLRTTPKGSGVADGPPGSGEPVYE